MDTLEQENNDLHKGEIYLIRNKINNKAYIGQAAKYVSKNNNKWGTNGRWKSHVREAFGGKADHCSLLNSAIRKYNPESFEVTKLVDCNLDEIDSLEREYIKEYNSLAPFGYNLCDGGAKGKDSDETRQKKSNSGKNKTITEQAKLNNSLGQLGNRHKQKPRKHERDSDLPKYVRVQRSKSINDDGSRSILGYYVEYPIGIVKEEYIRKRFNNKENPEQALNDALAFLKEVTEEYEQKVQHEIQARRKREQEAKADAKVAESFPVIDGYIHSIVKNNKLEGYIVKYRRNHLSNVQIDGTCTELKNTSNKSKHLQKKILPSMIGPRLTQFTKLINMA